MKFGNRKLNSLFTLFLCFGFLPIINNLSISANANPTPFFYVDILGPNYSVIRPMFPSYLVSELPKIGIGVDTVEETGWGNIAPRVWGYPGPYPIPTYDEGGYDMLFIGWSWPLDVDMTGLFDTPSFPPNGDNFYQYSRPEMDWAIANYSQSANPTEQLYWANEIQQLLYNDLPSITIFYAQEVYAHDENLSGWDPLIWDTYRQPMENWSIPNQSEFHYATYDEFEDFHIFQIESYIDAQWLEQIYDGIIIRDPETRGWTNRIATSWSSSDGYTYNVHLNPNTKWADGHVLNASDIEYSFNLYIDPNFTESDYGTFCPVYNNESVSIISEFEFNFTFLTTCIVPEDYLSQNLLPKHIWESVSPEDHRIQALNWAVNDTLDSKKIIGSGPYYLDDCNLTLNKIRLKRNEYFNDWTGITPYFEYIYFDYYPNSSSALTALSSGDIDMVDSNFIYNIEDIQNLNGTISTFFDIPYTEEIALNQLHPYFGTGELCPISGTDSALHIRKAISHIVPREKIIEEELNGIGSPGITPYPSAAFGFNSSLEPYEFSIELAKEHMRLAGFVYPEDTTIRFSFINLSIFLGFIALIGGCYFFIRRKKQS